MNQDQDDSQKMSAREAFKQISTYRDEIKQAVELKWSGGGAIDAAIEALREKASIE